MWTIQSLPNSRWGWNEITLVKCLARNTAHDKASPLIGETRPPGLAGRGAGVTVSGLGADGEALSSRRLVFEHRVLPTSLYSRPLGRKSVEGDRAARLSLPSALCLSPTRTPDPSSVGLSSTVSWGHSQVLSCDIGFLTPRHYFFFLS